MLETKENLILIKLFCAITAQAIIDCYKGKGRVKKESIEFFRSQEYEEIGNYIDKIAEKPHFKNLKKLVLEKPELAYKHKLVSIIETDDFAPVVVSKNKLKYTIKKEKAQKTLAL